MLPLELVSPDGSFSTLLLPYLSGEMPVGEGILEGGNGSCDRQLRPENSSAHPLAGEKVGTVAAWQLHSLTALDVEIL
jgi:hypothetical protein